MSDTQDMKITVTRDGPYKVTGNIRLDQENIGSDAQGNSIAWQKVKSYPVGERYLLCRCGRSRVTPKCDGTHNDVGFVGHEHADRPPYREHAKMQHGQTVDLLDDPTLCVGARFCDVGETVWRYVDQSGEPGHAMMAVEEACKCPSGRLTVVDKQGQLVEPTLEPGISVVDDPINNCRGPLWIKGGIPIEGANGEKYEVRNRVTLCRCGESANQPYCDGSHYECEHMHGLDT